MLSPHSHNGPLGIAVHRVSKTRDVTRNILQIESRTATPSVGIAALAAQVERETGQSRAADEVSKGKEIRGCSAQSVHANQGAAGLLDR